MLYKYDDEFLTANIETDELEKIEASIYNEIQNKLEVYDDFLKEKLTISKVYMRLATMQLESAGMKNKYDIYKSDFDFYYSRLKNAGAGVWNIPTIRG